MSVPNNDVWISRLSEYVDGELAPAEREEMETHLETCEACRVALREIEAVLNLLHADAEAAEPAVPVEAVWPRIAQRLVIAPASGHQTHRRPSPWPARFLAAGLLFLVAFAGGAWFGRAQCTGALPWTASGWAKAGLVAIGIGRSATRQTPPAAVPDSTDSVRRRATNLPQAKPTPSPVRANP
jgi:anti-sigma factor RsiW